MTMVDLMGSMDLMEGETTIGAGQSVTVGNTTISCPADGEDCVITVMQDSVTGGYSATATGGTPTVAVAPPPTPPTPTMVDLMGSMDLMAGTTTIPAGGSVTIGYTTVECPAGGDDCVLTVARDSVTGGYTATATGGMPTVAVAPPPTPPTPTTVDLMGSMDLMAGTTTIPAGGSVTIGYTTVECPAGGDDCVLTVAKDSVTGGYTATSTGGMPTVAVAQPPEPMAVDLMGSTELRMGTTTITAGESLVVGRTTVECPADGDDCVLTVAKNSVTGGYTATSIGGMPTVSVAPIVHYADLPKVHGLSDGDTFTVDAGDTHEMGGVEFECPASGGDCEVTIKEDEDGDLVASYTGGDDGLTTNQLVPTGYYAFTHPREGVSDLSDTILDRTDLDPNTPGVQTQLDDLRMNNFHGGPGSQAASSEMGRMYVSSGGSGVTSSVTTHDDPGAGNPNVTGVSDIMVTVTTTTTDPTSDDDDHRIVVVDTTADGTQAAPATTISNAVLKDGSTAWRDSISVSAGFANNPAADWMAGPLPSDDTVNMDDNADDIWTQYFRHVDDSLAGGRTLELDVRSDFGAGAFSHRVYDREEQTIVRGQRDNVGAYDEVTVAWTDVMSIDDTFPLALGTQIDLSTDGGEGLEGSYMGVRGRFVCVDGGASSGTTIVDNDGECKVDHEASGRMGVSQDDSIVFLPYIHDDDSNWLTAGVWLTIPQDEENGDYAVGAFVFGNDPFEVASENDARTLAGTATYNGEAFGRYAENQMIDAQAMVVGRFTADVTLTADFGDATTPAQVGGAATNNFGTISGTATKFVANDVPRDWDVSFEDATIMLDMDNATPPAIIQSELRFSSTASGHGDGGKATTGYWNGQFYGTAANNDDDPITGGDQPPWAEPLLPGSAAGTFGLTSERDPKDNYLLIMEGAFAAHQPED